MAHAFTPKFVFHQEELDVSRMQYIFFSLQHDLVFDVGNSLPCYKQFKSVMQY